MAEKLYIGSAKVVSSRKDEKTGRIFVKVEGSDREEDYHPKQFESVAKPEAYSDNDISVEKWSPAVGEILQVLLDYDMQMVDKDFVLNQVESSVVENMKQAQAIKLGVDHILHTKMSQIDQILRENKDKSS